MTETNAQNHKPVELAIQNSRPIVTSTEIARDFNKDHKDVLEAVENLISIVPPEWHKENFKFEAVRIEAGNEAESTVCFITRDGFSALPFGLTGKKAMARRCRYLESFTNLETTLRQKTYNKYLKAGNCSNFSENSLASCKAIIEGLLGFWANQDGLSYKTVNKLLCSHLYISTLDEIQIDQFQEAWRFIIQSACFLANKGQEMAPDKVENIQKLLAAAPNFKHSGGLPGDDLLHSLCGASMDNIPSVDGNKLLALAFGVFRYSEGFSFGFKRGQEAIIKDLVQ